VKILVVNCGSSSIKYRLFEIADSAQADELAAGLIERVGSDDAQIHHQAGENRIDRTRSIKDYHTGIAEIADHLETEGVLGGDLAGIGHRVVHGAEEFFESVIIDQRVVDQIERCCELAPLHNPANLAGIQACETIFSGIPQVAVFDTAFFHTLQPEAYLYGLPYDWYTRFRVRRYGFHGTSHRYVSQRAAELLARPLEKCNLITLHLGNGCSMAAIRQGKAVNTTMGLTPLEGLVMGTRCGDIDTAIVFHMLRVSGLDIKEIHQSLEKESGLLGVSQVSRDMRDVLEAADGGNKQAELAVKIFARRVRKYIGAYLAEIGPCHGLVFTGGIGENAWQVRELILEQLDHLTITLDRSKNRTVELNTAGQRIDADESKVPIMVVPTNEELAIASDTFNLVSKLTDSMVE